MTNINIWKRVMRYLGPYRYWASVALFGMMASIVLQIWIPTVLRGVIDYGIIGQTPLLDASPPFVEERFKRLGLALGDQQFITIAGILVVFLGLLRGITGFFVRYFGERLSHYIAYDIRNEVYDKVQNLSFSYHDEAQTGTLITRAISDVDEIQRYFAFGLIDGIQTLLLAIGVAIVMFSSDVLLGLIALSPLIPLTYFSYQFASQVEPMWKQVMERLQQLGNHIQENALGAEVVRAFNRERYEIERFHASNQMLYDERIRLIGRWASYIPLSALIIAFSTALVLFVGGLFEENGVGGITVGLVVAFNAYVLLLAQPIRFLGFVILLMTQAVSSAGRVFEILDAPVDIASKPNPVGLKEMQGIVRFEQVGFDYSGEGTSILRDINLEACPDQVVAILGATGSGKTSLVNLIPRFYDVTSGRITIDGVDVRDLDLSYLRQQIGVVLQSSLLFSASIRENIAFGKVGASDEEVIAAAKAASAHDFIMEFPDGYDTLVGERGVTLSGGQKQRIAIARALLINPRILILDDSVSSVDTKTEQYIRQALDILMRGKTTFLIAQRLSSVQNADQILVLDKGRIVQRGTHEELLEEDGPYRDVYDLQLADQERVVMSLLPWAMCLNRIMLIGDWRLMSSERSLTGLVAGTKGLRHVTGHR